MCPPGPQPLFGAESVCYNSWVSTASDKAMCLVLMVLLGCQAAQELHSHPSPTSVTPQRRAVSHLGLVWAWKCPLASWLPLWALWGTVTHGCTLYSKPS